MVPKREEMDFCHFIRICHFQHFAHGQSGGLARTTPPTVASLFPRSTSRCSQVQPPGFGEELHGGCSRLIRNVFWYSLIWVCGSHSNTSSRFVSTCGKINPSLTRIKELWWLRAASWHSCCSQAGNEEIGRMFCTNPHCCSRAACTICAVTAKYGVFEQWPQLVVCILLVALSIECKRCLEDLNIFHLFD